MRRRKTWFGICVTVALPPALICYHGDIGDGLIVGLPLAIAWLLAFFGKKWRIAVVVLCLLVIGPFMIPTLVPAFLSERAYACRSRLEAIGIALNAYHDEFGSYPPASSMDSDGERTVSWRELILPFMDAGEDPSVLFDCPKLRQRKFPFQGYAATSISPHTAYVAVVGDQTAWPNDGVTRQRDLIDGTHNTILVVEIYDSTIEWSSPTDISLEVATDGVFAKEPGLLGSPHIFVNALFADGTVQVLELTISKADLRRLFTINDGEPFERFEPAGTR